MSVEFLVWSRFTGRTDNLGDTWPLVTIDRPLGVESKDRVLASAAAAGWYMQNGYTESSKLLHIGEVVLHDPENPADHYMHLEFGTKGQITYLNITRPGLRGPFGRRISAQKLAAALAEFGNPLT